MNLIDHNFGLDGQAYDTFLCGKRCRKRRQERHRLRMEKRALKNDARKADTERLRAETAIMQQTVGANVTSPNPVIEQAPTAQKVNRPAPRINPYVAGILENNSSTPKPPTQKRGSYLPWILVGVLLIGGGVVVYFKTKK